MTAPNAPVLAGEIVEEELTLTLDELCGACAAEREWVLELVEHGLLEVHAGAVPLFGGIALRRARLALSLQRDLGVNAAGAALVVELLERLELLEAQRRGN